MAGGQSGQSFPLLCCEEGRSLGLANELYAEKDKIIVKFSNQNKRFYNNVTLALSVAAYVTVFGLPVYSQYMSWLIFGEKHRLVGMEYVDTCGPNMMGVKVNAGNDSHPILVNYNTTSIKNGVEPYAWCGFVPGSYFAAWPGVVQTAMFTVYRNTGSTVKLAWQCIAGTFSAVLNIYFLTWFYPHGAADPTYQWWVGWVDIVVVLFLFLASRADQNTMMMGMSWTVCLMLHFMNPKTGSTLGTYKSPIPYVNWDGETTVVMLTSIMGCCIAVFATIIPKPLMNIRRVHDDATEVAKAIDMIFSEAIEYWKESAPGPKRFQVYAKMAALSETTGRVRQNLEDSYWETFDFYKYGRMRKLYNMFNEAIVRNEDEVYLVKAATQSIDFDSTLHSDIVKAVHAPLEQLKKDTVACLNLCAICCRDGHISPEEQHRIEDMVKKIDDTQQQLSNEFQIVMRSKAYCSQEIAADSLFVFSVCQWAEELKDFAHDLSHFESQWQTKHFENPILRLGHTASHQITYIFDPRAMFSTEQLRYTLMNGIPIMLTYLMSMYLNCSVFVKFSATMPATLAVLVTYDYGATFFKNVQRLMGVVFGHTLPLLVMGVITMFPCDSQFRFALHSACLFVFYFMFCFMYYASEQWATVGVLIAGFGCYPMFHQCDVKGTPVDYGSHYKDIAQVIIAILLKMAVANLLAPKQPRDNALDSLNQLSVSIHKAFEAFFAGDIEGPEGLKVQRDMVKTHLTACETIAPKCDPSLEIVPGGRTHFKHNLFNKALEQFRLVLSDIDMLVLAMTGHQAQHFKECKVSDEDQQQDAKENVQARMQEASLFDVMSRQPAWKTVHEDLNSTVQSVLSLLQAVLSHDTEEPLKADAVDRLKRMEKIMDLQGVTEFYKEVSKELGNRNESDEQIFQDVRIITQLKRTRLTVAMNALSLATSHTAEMTALCFEYMLYA